MTPSISYIPAVERCHATTLIARTASRACWLEACESYMGPFPCLMNAFVADGSNSYAPVTERHLMLSLNKLSIDT